MPRVAPQFDIVRASGAFVADIGDQISRIPQTTIASAGVATSLSRQTGNILSNPPMPAVNAQVNGITTTLNDLSKNPGGVLRAQAGALVGRGSASLKVQVGGLGRILKAGIRNCLLNSIRSLTNKIPNLPFGGIDIRVNKKLNDMLNLQLRLGIDLFNQRAALTISLNAKLDGFKQLKKINSMTSSLQGEVNKHINGVCNKISPRNKKGFSRGNRYIDSYVAAQVDSVLNCVEKKMIRASAAAGIPSPTDFFDKITGKILAPGQINVSIPGADTISGTLNDANSAIAKVTGKVAGALQTVGNTANKAVDSINNAINSNVAKIIPDEREC